MQNTIRKNGFILLLVIAMIPLIGMVLAIIMTNSNLLIIRTRRGELQAQAQNACLSGQAWAQQNREKVQLLVPEDPIILTIEDGIRHINCRIERVQDMTNGEMLLIIGHAEDSRFSVDYKLQNVFLTLQ
ncbi:MAG: hypothetical protein ISS71_00740 [Phycisphaerae bacterium]|nr:hypothetical protein [Phycisphaerae bacterium]